MSRKLLRIACPVALAAVLVVIWALTVQTPADTTSLSDGWAAVISQVTGLSFGQAAWVARKVVHTFEFFPVGLFVALTAVAWNREPVWQQGRYLQRASSRPSRQPALRGRHVRPDAVLAAVTQHRIYLLVAIVVLCFACSLGDQVHKIFVPGREFDALDMCFDAIGYLLGIWVAAELARSVRMRAPSSW